MRSNFESTRSSDGQRELTLIGIDVWIYSRPGGEHNRIVFDEPSGQLRGPLVNTRASRNSDGTEAPLFSYRALCSFTVGESVALSYVLVSMPASLRPSCSHDLGCAREPEYRLVPATRSFPVSFAAATMNAKATFDFQGDRISH